MCILTHFLKRPLTCNSVMISFFEKLTAPMPAYLLADMADPPNAGALYGQ
jgi:hypothetical protein